MKYIAYYRKSPGGGKTKKQLLDSFSIEAQRDLVAKFAPVLESEFTEAESGKNNLRPELKKAIVECKRIGATLVVAKVDRLGRNAAYLLNLIDSSGVDFIFANMPTATKLVIGIMALVAESEADTISDRIKAAFEVKRNRGEKLGRSENFSNEGRRKGCLVASELALANENNIRAKAMISSYTGTLQETADFLNSNGFRTSRGKKFQPTTVKRLKNEQHNASTM
jgi:DNA invertase Pin-like site-specific DNA recombinase